MAKRQEDQMIVFYILTDPSNSLQKKGYREEHRARNPREIQASVVYVARRQPGVSVWAERPDGTFLWGLDRAGCAQLPKKLALRENFYGQWPEFPRKPVALE